MQIQPTWYFAFGLSEKSSLLEQFCSEHHYVYLRKATLEVLQQYLQQNTYLIIEADLDVFKSVEAIKYQVQTVFVGSSFTEEEVALREEYRKIGKCIQVNQLSYQVFRKAMYPNLVFLFSPNQKAIKALASEYFVFLGYSIIQNFVRVNDLIAHYPKSRDYVITGFISSPEELIILEEFFNLRVIHFKYDPNQLIGYQQFFKWEAKLIPSFKNKSYSLQIQSQHNKPIDKHIIGSYICPQLVYLHAHSSQTKRHLQNDLQTTNQLTLSIFDIQAILKRKPRNLRSDYTQKIQLISQIIYKDLNRKIIFLSDFPWTTEEFRLLEASTRKISKFFDATQLSQYEYSKSFSSCISFLERQQRCRVNLQFPVIKQIKEAKDYFLVQGASCSGKSSVSKYMCSEFGYNLIEYESYVAVLKQKLISAEDGQELPLKKIMQHFVQLIQKSEKAILIDGLNINEKEIATWVQHLGSPTVINLKVQEHQLIRRTRKKYQSDLAAEVSEEEQTKIRQNIAKKAQWIDELARVCPDSTIYQVQFNQPMLLCEKLISSILKPRIYLIQGNSSLLFQNIAIKYDLGFINLQTHPLKVCQDLIKKNKKRDVILCNYLSNSNEKLVSEDLYWIQKQLGTIRYLGIWWDEDKQSNDVKLELMRPVKEEKVKAVVEGEDPVEDPPEGEEEVKKKFDIYEYEWTKPTNHQNLSQWFFKLKKNIQQKQRNVEQCYKGFQEVVEQLSQDKNLNIYEKIK